MKNILGKSLIVNEKFLTEHTKLVDKEVANLYSTNAKTSQIHDCFKRRGFTYTEYLQLFDMSIQEGQFAEYVIFIVLEIEVEHGYNTPDRRVNGRKDFTNLYLGNEKGFEALLYDTYGKRFFSRLRAAVPYGSIKEHVHVTGKTRSGKSEFLRLLFYSLQERSQKKNSNSILLVDPHGDLAKKIKSSKLNVNSKRLIYICPSFKKGYYPVLNPLQLEDMNLLDKTTEFIVEVFDELVADSELSGSMRTILTPCVRTLLKEGNKDLSDLQRFLSDDPELVALGKRSDVKSHRDFFNEKYLDKSFGRTKNSVYTRIQNLLNSPQFYSMTMGQSTFNLKKAMNGGKVVLFDLSGLGGITKEAFGRLLLAQIKAIAENRESIKKERRKPTFLFIDECHNYISRSVEKTLAEMGKYGLHLILAHQYIQQLGDLANAVLSNTDMKVVFKNHEGTLGKFSSYMQISVPEMRAKWGKYECWIKTGEGRTKKIKPSGRLIKKKKYTMTEEEESALDKYLLSKYYRLMVPSQFDNKETKIDVNLSGSVFPEESDF